MLASFIKLIGCLPMLTVGEPDPKTKMVSVWPYKCYLCHRIIAIIVSILFIAAQTGASIYAIATPQH